MKSIATILSIFICLLIAQPTIQLVLASSTSEEVCSDECCNSVNGCSDSDSGKQNAGDCCPGGVCNPFESCYCCAGWNVTYPFMQVVVTTVNIDFNPQNVTNPVLGFRSDCFHPPEVV